MASFPPSSSSSKALRSEYYARFRFFDLTKNKLITNIRYFENAAPGHLIDSAHNNLRRLIVTQYQDSQKIVYDQDFWVSIQDYQQMDTQDIIDLWTLMNRQFVRTIRRTPPERYHLTTDVGSTVAEHLTISQLIQMYTDHMAHHLKQIFD